jgi:hypothetical protein
LPFWKSAGYIIAMSVAPRALEICGPARPCRRPRPQLILSKDGRYSVAKLIAKHGRKGNMSAWVLNLKGDCPMPRRRRAAKPLRRGVS